MNELIERPDAPIVWHDRNGYDLCGPCAESRDDIEYGDVFVNWRDYDHRCMLCNERFMLEDTDG